MTGLSGESIIREIKASGIEFVISVPDITTSEGLLRPLAKLTDPRLIRICKEDEGVGDLRRPVVHRQARRCC